MTATAAKTRETTVDSTSSHTSEQHIRENDAEAAPNGPITDEVAIRIPRLPRLPDTGAEPAAENSHSARDKMNSVTAVVKTRHVYLVARCTGRSAITD